MKQRPEVATLTSLRSATAALGFGMESRLCRMKQDAIQIVGEAKTTRQVAAKTSGRLKPAKSHKRRGNSIA
jgi:hypothetical protein